ncbi:unnamed protein product [Rotaria sp. Silwood1]|nr:unnamed protein product [Rotaria sp. Silwood1]CAF3416348.1 unnamed protein product [Rotaria sp. Silwood1]CAF4564096.1 unnamed protein product [Rotaria sp. Silwood1]CAF4708001.1 unnamed protein product [Rotaria sp. Silwood1]
MLQFILILLIGLSNLPKTTPCAAQWDQCGGIGWTGPTTCCAPYVCTYSNDWYSQCLQGSSSSSSANQGCSALWGQCAGIGWTGPTTCCAPYVCTYSNDWYSQCLQGPTQPPSSSSSSSSANQGCSALWGQCGGIGWTGPTCCSQSICVVTNQYYSQCLQSGTSSGSSSASSSTIGTATLSVDTSRQAGVTTRYWDCCKASCAWSGKASVTSPVRTCAQDGTTTITDPNTQSGCNGGSAYMCVNQQPWNVSSTLSYGFAAAHIAGQSEADWCCACYSLIFTSGPVVGKELIVQVTNTGGDLGNNHFDLQMPGGGVGLFDGCSRQFPGSYSWGQTYGGVSQRSNCSGLPAVLQTGCYWRFDWFMGADNPTMSFKQVSCPAELTSKTQCIRQ